MRATRASAAYPDSAASGQLRLGLIGDVVAGIETQFRNLSAVINRIPDLEPWTLPVTPFRPDDAIERYLKMLPASTRSTLRQTASTAGLFRRRDLDLVWTQVSLPLLPWVASSTLLGRTPFVFTTDCTPRLLRDFKAHYSYWGSRSPLKQRVRDTLYRAFVNRAALLNPWTAWAARSIAQDYDVPEERIVVVPPGVDTGFWRPGREGLRAAGEGQVRLLFVGGDFERKGGDLLLEVCRGRLRAKVHVDLVTRYAVEGEPNVAVHSGLGPNDERLLYLFQQADIFVLPTRADCFSMAGLEAMAAGLPVITCPVGGVAELFEQGREGLFVQPDDGRALGTALDLLIADPARRIAMGRRARKLATARYSAEINTRRLLDLIRAVVASTARNQ